MLLCLPGRHRDLPSFPTRRSSDLWDEGPNKDLNSAQIYDSLKRAASGKAASLYSVGDVTKASGRRITAAYQLPFMAHAPMEPGNCTAHYRGSNCELWAPTQVPQDVRDSVAQAVGLDPDQVKVNVTLAGGGFGRRLEHDYGVEAALVSKAIKIGRASCREGGEWSGGGGWV